MNMHRTPITDLPNPAKRIGELEAELLRVRAALDEARADAELQQKNITFKAKQLIELRAELAEAHELDTKQHAAIVRDTLEIGELAALSAAPLPQARDTAMPNTNDHEQ